MNKTETEKKVEISTKINRPEIFGFIDTLKQQLGGIVTWNNRYFVLDTFGVLHSYPPQSVKPTTNLNMIADIIKEDAISTKISNSTFHIEKVKGKDECIIIQTGNKEIVFSFKNEEILMNWKKSLVDCGCKFVDKGTKIKKGYGVNLTKTTSEKNEKKREKTIIKRSGTLTDEKKLTTSTPLELKTRNEQLERDLIQKEKELFTQRDMNEKMRKEVEMNQGKAEQLEKSAKEFQEKILAMEKKIQELQDELDKHKKPEEKKDEKKEEKKDEEKQPEIKEEKETPKEEILNINEAK